jgi:hypothetical protein
LSIRRSIENGSKVVTFGIGAARSSIAHGSRAATEVARSSIVEGSRTIVKGSRVAGEAITKSIQTAGDKGVETVKKAQEAGTTIVASAAAVVPMLLNKSEGAPREGGFVVFTTLYTTQTALQMIHHPDPYIMEATAAPEPSDIFWRNVGLPHQARRSGRVVAVAATSVLCLFWSFPMAFISSLTELESLKETMPKLGEWLDDRPGAQKFLALLAPALLLFMNEVILPAILKTFAKWEGLISHGLLEVSLFVKLGCFQVRPQDSTFVGRLVSPSYCLTHPNFCPLVTDHSNILCFGHFWRSYG